MSRRDWVRAYGERAGIRDREAAERSAANIARALGGCLTWREAQTLAGVLPEPLAGAMSAGAFSSAMARFSASAFVSRVAEADEVDPEVALPRAGAFLALLRAWLPDRDVDRLERELASWLPEVAAAH
jgi:uncharacterized protein (DUF2267 family)